MFTNKLFLGSSNILEYESSRCTPMRTNITFSDEANESILDYSSLIPIEGTFRPAERLSSHFDDDFVNGIWELTVFDSKIDKEVGMLMDWRLNFKVDYCSEEISWARISSNSNTCEKATVSNGKLINSVCNRYGGDLKTVEMFTPRYSHTSIAVGNDVFVVGGYDQGVRSEIWRFTYSTKKWIQLHDSLLRPHSIGQAATLTPFGLITIGGLRSTFSESSFHEEIFVYDVLGRTQKRLEVQFK